VTYDLGSLNHDQLFGLKDTLLTALNQYRAGPKTIQVQLCLAVVGLALQFPQWKTPIQILLHTYGRDPSLVPILLELLAVLPEEVNGNTKIPISVRFPPFVFHLLDIEPSLKDDEFRQRAPALLSENAPEVLELLAMYSQAQGKESAISY